VVGLIAWDTTADAAEFEPVFRTYLERRKPGRHAVVRTKDRVAFCTETGAPAAAELARAALAAFRPAAAVSRRGNP
jgi:hypothetical protein